MIGQGEHIGLDAWLLAIYFALSPMHQTLVLPNGSTIVKYLAFGVMIACVVWGYIEKRCFFLRWDLLWPLILIFGWFALTVLWADSRNTAIASLTTIGSYCLLMLIVGSRKWNDKECFLFIIILIISCVFYAVQLINNVTTTKRATLTYIISEIETKADQNVVALNIGLGALTAFYCFLQRKRGVIKWTVLICVCVILIGIICTGSRGGLIAFFAGALYMLFGQIEVSWQQKSRYLLIIGIFFILFFIIFDINILQNNYIATRFRNTSIESLRGRLEIWGQYIELLISRPIGFLCGYGSGCDSIAHASHLGRNWIRASHNDAISILCQAGIPALVLSGSFVAHCWRYSKRRMNTLGCACIILVIIGSMDINVFKTYGWWNGMIIAYIGLGDQTNQKRIVSSER